MLIPLVVLACTTQVPQGYDFADKSHLPADLRTPSSLNFATADLTADGSPDLLLAEQGMLRLLANDGHGVFTDASARLGAFAPPTPGLLLTPDVDGDGDADLVVTTSRNEVRVVRNDAGTLVEIPFAAPGSFGVSLGRTADLDGDGDVDLLLQQQNRTAVFVNDGSGRFTDTNALPAQFNVLDLVAEDLDLDGDVDVLIVQPIGLGDGHLQLWLNDGSGTFTEAPTAMPALPAWHAVATDVDGDLDPDLVVIEDLPIGTPDRFQVLVNDGAGSFTAVGARGLLAPETGDSLARADLDGNGAPELVVLGFGRTAVYRHDGSGSFVPVTGNGLPEDGGGILRAAFADLDGDRDIDVVGSNFARVFLLLNVDRGRFAPGVTRGLPTDDPLGAVVRTADLDRDGFLEILSSGASAGSSPDLFRFDQTSDRYVRDARWPVLAADARDLLFEDLTGDELPDVYLAMGGFGGGAVGDRLFVNFRGRLADVTATTLPANVGASVAVRAADLDGDGNRDLIVRGASLRILLFRSFSFVDGGSLPMVSSGAALLDVADVDLDGDVDILLSDALLANDGSAHFSDASALLPATFTSVRVAVFADLDGDGDEDLYCGRPAIQGGPQQDLLIENRGGRLVDVTLGALPIALRNTNGVEVADFDSDGDPDVLLDGPVFLRNDGGLRFTQVLVTLPAPAGLPGLPVHALGDVDRDGDADLSVRQQIAHGTATQLVARYLPRVGADWPVELHAGAAPAGSTLASLWLGTRESFTRVPGIPGVLSLDPATAVPVANLVIPGPRSPGRNVIRIPADPSLLGVRFVAQAIFVTNGAARFGNRVRGEIQ
ncbi:MAG: VCBS repeat-containing protein [Planctomycetes bacterium]|nr:VCBS repeat-containing protein [Planctomycetota bacterium]